MKKYHLLHYVENCSPKIKKFKSIKSLRTFVENFENKHPFDEHGDHWIDYAVTNITGELLIFDESINYES